RGGDVLRQAQASLEWRPGEYNALTAEVRRIEERRQAQATAAGMLGAVKYTHRFGTALDLYGIGQVTLDDDGGQYEDNVALALGGRYNSANLSTVGAEATTGDRGEGASVEAEYKVSPLESFYGSYSCFTDRSDFDPLFKP